MSQANAVVHYTTHPHASSGNKHTRHQQRKNANFATQNISLSDTNEIILPGSFAFVGSHDLPHREGLGILGVHIDPLDGVGDGDREALVPKGEEIHCQFILVVYHQKEKLQ